MPECPIVSVQTLPECWAALPSADTSFLKSVVYLLETETRDARRDEARESRSRMERELKLGSFFLI